MLCIQENNSSLYMWFLNALFLYSLVHCTRFRLNAIILEHLVCLAHGTTMMEKEKSGKWRENEVWTEKTWTERRVRSTTWKQEREMGEGETDKTRDKSRMDRQYAVNSSLKTRIYVRRSENPIIIQFLQWITVFCLLHICSIYPFNDAPIKFNCTYARNRCEY